MVVAVEEHHGSSSHPGRRQLHDRVPRKLQRHCPILAGADTIVSVAAHIQGAIKTFPDAVILSEVTSPHADLARRRSLRHPPQQLDQLSSKLFVSRQRFTQ